MELRLKTGKMSMTKKKVNLNKIEKIKSIMNQHKEIHIKIKDNEYSNATRKKKFIFKGKYCKTYMYEDEEIFLKSKHLFRKISPKKVNRKSLLIRNTVDTSNNINLKTSFIKIPTNNSMEKTQILPKIKNSTELDLSMINKNSNNIDKVKESKHFPSNEVEKLKDNIFFLDKKYGVTQNMKISSYFSKNTCDNKSIENQPNKKTNILKNIKNKRVDSGRFEFISFDKEDFYFSHL